MKSFRVHILAADHTFYDGPCESLIVPAPDGQYGVCAGHANTICAIVPGTLACARRKRTDCRSFLRRSQDRG